MSSGDWDSTYSFVNSDSATNNSLYNRSHYVNMDGDVMTGSLEIKSSELIVGGNITMAGDLIHQNDTGTRLSFVPDIITLEVNGQEYITLDGTSPTPDSVIINSPAEDAINFEIKSISTDRPVSFYTDGTTGHVGVGGKSIDTHTMHVDGTMNVSVSALIDTLHVTNDMSTDSQIISAGVPLHDIFSIDTDVKGDQTVHGDQTITKEQLVNGKATFNNDIHVKGDIITDGNIINDDLIVTQLTTLSANSTYDDTGTRRTGVTQDVNIGGHVLHIVNGLIVGVTDE